PASAMDAVRKLVNVDDVSIVLGEYSSGISVPTGQFTNSNGVIQVGIGSTSPKLAEIGPYYFNVIGTDVLMGRKLGEFAVEDSGAKTFMSITPNNPFGVGVEIQACERVAELDGECVTTSRYELEKSDYRPIIQATFREDAEAGFFTAYGTEARLILRQMYELGMKPAKGWYADYPTMWSNEVKDIAEVAEGIKGLRPGPSGGGFYESEYAEAYEEKYGEAPTTAFGSYAYDAAMLVALAIESAGSTDADAVKDHMQPVSTNYKGVTGDKSFDDNGMQADETYQRVIYKDGELVPYGS
ncbi:MAG TPA: ABC transporter substrate-binding protein, partial [Arenicellales bacterium]|nr:ABC transporter substrate-binding protein [Arenicellales bacterium]